MDRGCRSMELWMAALYSFPVDCCLASLFMPIGLGLWMLCYHSDTVYVQFRDFVAKKTLMFLRFSCGEVPALYVNLQDSNNVVLHCDTFTRDCRNEQSFSFKAAEPVACERTSCLSPKHAVMWHLKDTSKYLETHFLTTWTILYQNFARPRPTSLARTWVSACCAALAKCPEECSS